MFGNTDKTITVENTKWGKSYKISTVPVGDTDVQRVAIEFNTGSKYVSKLVFKEDEIGEPIAWLQEFTKDNNLVDILDRFKKVVENTPFDQ